MGSGGLANEWGGEGDLPWLIMGWVDCVFDIGSDPRGGGGDGGYLG